MLERLFDEMFYTYFVRLHLEYACPVWHPGISRDESQKTNPFKKAP